MRWELARSGLETPRAESQAVAALCVCNVIRAVLSGLTSIGEVSFHNKS